MDYPNYAKELAVIQLKVPELDSELAAKATQFVQALREQDLSKVPGLSEAVDWSRALQVTGAKTVDRNAVENTVGCLLKDRRDIVKLKTEMLDPLLAKVGDQPR
jgi:MoxR-like ATPase